MMSLRAVCVALLLVTVSWPSFTFASARGAYQPYCGIHSVYAAALAEGLETPFESFLKPEYVGCSAGSTLGELKQAAEDHGLHALPVGGWGWRTLQHTPHPVVLHVRGDITVDRFNHYVLCLGYDDGRFTILDAGKPLQAWTPAELSIMWSGNALVVSAGPIDRAALTAPGWRAGYLLAGGGIALVWGVFFARRTFPRLRPETPDPPPSRGHVLKTCLAQCCVIFGVGMLLAVAHHATTRDGFFTADGAAALAGAYNPPAPVRVPADPEEEMP